MVFSVEAPRLGMVLRGLHAVAVYVNCARSVLRRRADWST